MNVGILGVESLGNAESILSFIQLFILLLAQQYLWGYLF